MSKSKQHEDELVPVDENGEIRCPKCNAEMEGHGVIGHDRHNRECEADWMECPLCGHVMGMELTRPNRDKSDSAMLDWLLNRSSKRKGASLLVSRRRRQRVADPVTGRHRKENG